MRSIQEIVLVQISGIWHNAYVLARCAQPPRDDRDDLIEHQQHEITRLREELARAEQQRREAERDRDRLKRQNEHLKQQLDAARRAGFRQAAPFAKDRPQGRGGHPGRRAGAAYGCHARRPTPPAVDETYTAAIAPGVSGLWRRPPVHARCRAVPGRRAAGPPDRPRVPCAHWRVSAVWPPRARPASPANLRRARCRGGATQQILMTVFRTSRQRALDPIGVIGDLLRERVPRIAPVLFPP